LTKWPRVWIAILSVLWLFSRAEAAGGAIADRWDIAIEKALGSVVVGAFVQADGEVSDPVLRHWLQLVGGSVSKGLDSPMQPRFLLVDSAVPNAWSVPGGTIVVTRGLLESVDSDDALAVILAHECAHVAGRHAWRQMVENLGVLALVGRLGNLGRNGRSLAMAANLLRAMSRSRTMETEADRRGVDIAAGAGWNPEAFAPFLGTADSALPDWLSSHPSGFDRRTALKRHPAVLGQTHARVARPDALPAWRELPSVPRAPDPDGKRSRLERRCSDVAKRLASTGRLSDAGSFLQQALLLTTDIGNPAHLILASQAWALQQQVGGVGAGIARTVVVAPNVWDRLEAAPPVDAAVGRGEVETAAIMAADAVADLESARRAVGLVLANLNVRGLPSRRFSTAAPEFAVQEGLLQLGEDRLARARTRVREAAKWIAQARIRAYIARLGTLAGANSERIAWMRKNLARRIGVEPTEAASLDHIVQWALAGAIGCRRDEAAELLAGADAASIAGKWNVAPTVALVLRLTTLDAERRWE